MDGGQNNGHRRTSSVDILSEDLGESGAAASTGPPGLKPKVLTARDLEEQQREAAKSEEIVKAKVSPSGI